MTSLRSYGLAMVLLAGCSKSGPKIEGPPCEEKALAAFDALLDKANGLNVDLTDERVKADIAEAKTKVTGTKVSFTGCTFRSQGNDIVSFGAVTGETEIHCTMKGGTEAVTEFRRAAMKIGQDKVRLDVRGQVAMGTAIGTERLELRDCEIATHE